jgi:Uncharacterized conserved protein (DUF2285)
MNTASRKQAPAKRYQLEKFVGDPKVARYKWEFLRRNEEYQRDYAALADQFGEWIQRYGGWNPPGYVKDQSPQAWSYFREQVEPAVWKVAQRWGIRDPVNPALSRYPPQFLSRDFPISVLKARRPEEENEDNPESPEPLVRDYFSHMLGDAPHSAKGLSFIKVQIDITQPLETIIAQLEITIEIARSRYRVHIDPLADFRKEARIRLDQYESCLNVWDLRKQDLTFEQIAFRLFQREMEEPAFRNAITKRVRSQFQRAKELIEGGYRQIEG